MNVDSKALTSELQALARHRALDHLQPSLIGLANGIGNPSAVGLWAGVDLWQHFIGRTVTVGRSAAVRALEAVRTVLVFAPILITWFGIWDASRAHVALREAGSPEVARPFLSLWQSGFEGRSITTLQLIALADVVAIVLIALVSVRLMQLDSRRELETQLVESRLHRAIAQVEWLIAPLALRSQEDVQQAFARAMGSLVQLDQAVALLARFGDQIESMERSAASIEQASKGATSAAASTEQAVSELRTAVLQAGSSVGTAVADLTSEAGDVSASLQRSSESVERASKDLGDVAAELAEIMDGLSAGGANVADVLDRQVTALVEAGRTAEASRALLERLGSDARSVGDSLARSAGALNGAGMDFTDQLDRSAAELSALAGAQSQLMQMLAQLERASAVALRELRLAAGSARPASGPVWAGHSDPSVSSS